MTTNTKAREYLRASLDKTGEARSTNEQHTENEKAASANGWQLGTPYTDNGRSASDFGTKVREAYGQLISDLTRDRFGADILILWEASRASRQTGEWVELVKLCKARGVRIHITTHGTTYDPANARHWRSLLEDALDSEYESNKLSLRLRRAQAQRAQEGMPFGRVAYGYDRRYAIVNHKKVLIAQEPHPVEASIVRELFERILKGHSLRSIAKDFERRGITKHSGGPFSSAHLRDIALRPLYAGKRHHRPGTTALRSNNPNVKGTLYDGTWEALVSEKTFYAVQRILNDPSRKTSRPGRGKHLVSMIARCDVCSGPLAATNRDDRYGPQYTCQKGGHVRVSYDDLNGLAESAILAYLSNSENAERLRANDGRHDAELEAIENELAKHRARLDELEAEVRRGDNNSRMATAEANSLEARIVEAEQRRKDLSTPSVLRELAPGKDVALRWQAAPMSTKREVAKLLFAPGKLGELRVMRSPQRARRGPIEDRVSQLAA